jgi:site-specific recombinase XerD
MSPCLAVAQMFVGFCADLSKWKRRSIHDIKRADVIELLDGIVDRGSPITANRVLAAVRKMFAWAASRDMIGASPCVGVKPPASETAAIGC